MGILSLFKNLNLGFGMPNMPTTTSASAMDAKEYKEVEHDNKMSLAGDHNEITGVEKDKRFRNDEVSYHDLKRVFIGYPPKSSVPDCPYHLQTGFCTIGMDCKFNHPSREENVEGKLEEAVSGLRRLAKFKGDQGLGHILSSENVGQIECKENVEGKLEEAVSGLRRLAKFKGDQGLGHITSSENVGQIECKFYLLPGGCKYGNDCGFLHHVELNFMGLPIRLGEKLCPFYMRNGGCKFASRCKFHHPDPTAVVGHSFQDQKNGVPSQDHGPVEQLCETSRPSEKTSNEQTTYLGLFTPNRELQQNVHWNGDQTATSQLHPREMNINDQRTTLANKHIAYEFSGGAELQQFEEYPQMPSEPECQYFMKTGYCKFKSACRYHHPKSNVSFLGLSERPSSNNHQHRGPVEQLSETPLPSVITSNEQTGFLGPSSSYVPDLFAPNQGLKQNAQWNEHQTVTSLMHPPEIKKVDEQQALANKDDAYEFSGGEPQQFDEYPQRPGKPECQYFMKTGYCKFNSACRYHHPKSTLNSLSLPLRPARNNFEQDGTVEQICEIPLPSENSSNDQSTFLCLPSSNVPDLFTPNQGLQPNVQWNGDQTVTSPLHPPEIKKNYQQQALANKDDAYEFSGGEPRQFDEYPQRPGKPECQYFMKTGYCKFNSACRYHHPKSTLSYLSLPLRPARNNYEQDGLVEQICEIPLPSENSSNDQSTFLSLSSSNVPDLFTPNQGLQPNVQWDGDQMAADPLHPPEIKMIEKIEELAYNDTPYEFNSGVKSQQFDEYPQRPGEPECQYFMQTGYCKFKSSCIFHHPKSNLSFLSPPLKPDKPICTYYSRHGKCKFGSACRYNHHMDHTKHMQH